MILQRPKALLLDMDGTLTAPMLDFARIKSEMGIGNAPILETLATLSEERRRKCQQILDRHEEAAARESTLNPGCEALLAWCTANQISTAVITRNSRRNCELVVLKHNLSFQHLITRDDGVFKPDPTPLLLACQKLHVNVADAWMVGDGSYDVEAGNAAHMTTVWISHGTTPTIDAIPSATVYDLVGLRVLLESIE